MKILALDTATELCSAALLDRGEVLITRELETARGHAEHILPMIDAVLAEGGLELRDLDAIAFGRGPGGFTGVRLAASVTQGLAFGAGLPVVPVSDLAAVAQRAFDLDAQQPPRARLQRCTDAGSVLGLLSSGRRRGKQSIVGSEQVGPAADVAPALHRSRLAAGRGFRVYPELVARVARTFDDLLPRAAEIARLAVDAPQACGRNRHYRFMSAMTSRDRRHESVTRATCNTRARNEADTCPPNRS